MKPLKFTSIAFAAFAVLSIPAAAASASSTPTPAPTPIQANNWTFEKDGGIVPNADSAPGGPQSNEVVLGICRGSFNGPEKSGSSVFTSTYIQCDEPAAISASTALDKCVRSGGADDFTCTTVKRGHNSTTGNAYYLQVSVYYSPCKTGEYRPRAYYQTVNGEEYPDVTGNVVKVTC